VPAGKKVKCPKCANIFAAPAADAKVAAAVRSGAPAASTGGARTDVRTGKPPALPAARRPARPAEDDEDDRKERRERKGSKKRKKKKQSNLPLLLGVGGGAGALIAVLVILGFVWPGFFVPKEKARKAQPVVAQEAPKNPDGLPAGTGQEDLLNFVPPGCNIFAGLDLSIVDKLPDAKRQRQMMPVLASMLLRGAPPGAGELIADVDRVVAAANLNEKTGVGGSVVPEGIVVLRMKSPYTKDKVLQLMQSGKEPVQKKDKTVYLPLGTKEDNEPVPMVYMHNDRVLIFAVAPSQRLEKMLEFDGVKPAVSPEDQRTFRLMDPTVFWVTVHVTPTIEEFLAKIDPNALAAIGPELQPALAPLQKLKGATFAVEALENPMRLKFQLAAKCASDADAQQMQKAVQGFWENKGKVYLTSVKPFIPPNAAAAAEPLLNDITNNFTVKAVGPVVVLDLVFSEQTIQAIKAQSNQLQQMMPGGMPSRPGMQPGQQPPGRPQGGRPPRGRPAGR
jgi:hypothetical protein